MLLSRSTGAATLVKRGWSDDDVPCNDVVTMDRSDPADHKIIAWMAGADTDSATLYTVRASDGAVLSKTPTPDSVIFYCAEFNHASGAPGGDATNSTYLLGTAAPAPGEPFVSFFARLRADGSGAWEQIGPGGNFEKYGYIEGVAAAAPSLGILFAVGEAASGAFTLFGVSTATGLVVYERDVSSFIYLSALHYHTAL